MRKLLGRPQKRGVSENRRQQPRQSLVAAQSGVRKGRSRHHGNRLRGKDRVVRFFIAPSRYMSTRAFTLRPRAT